MFGDRSSGEAHIAQITVVEAEAPRLFSFRWTHPEDEDAREGNSLLVTFVLTGHAGGTLLRMTEGRVPGDGLGGGCVAGEQQYQEHVQGWGHFLPRLVDLRGHGRGVRRDPRVVD